MAPLSLSYQRPIVRVGPCYPPQRVTGRHVSRRTPPRAIPPRPFHVPPSPTLEPRLTRPVITWSACFPSDCSKVSSNTALAGFGFTETSHDDQAGSTSPWWRCLAAVVLLWAASAARALSGLAPGRDRPASPRAPCRPWLQYQGRLTRVRSGRTPSAAPHWLDLPPIRRRAPAASRLWSEIKSRQRHPAASSPPSWATSGRARPPPFQRPAALWLEVAVEGDSVGHRPPARRSCRWPTPCALRPGALISDTSGEPVPHRPQPGRRRRPASGRRPAASAATSSAAPTPIRAAPSPPASSPSSASIRPSPGTARSRLPSVTFSGSGTTLAGLGHRLYRHHPSLPALPAGDGQRLGIHATAWPRWRALRTTGTRQ